MNTSSTLKKSIITVISATFARCAVFAPLSVYLSYLYTYIESVTLGIFMTVCRVIADFLVCLSVYAMLGGIYTLVRAHKIKGASLCAASYILSLAAGALISYFIELLMVKAGMTDYTEAMFAEETGDIFLTAVISLLSALFLLFFTFVFSFALRPASDRAVRLFSLISYTVGVMIQEAVSLVALVAAYGAPSDVFEVLSLSMPFIEQGVFAVAGYYFIGIFQPQKEHHS